MCSQGYAEVSKDSSTA